MHHKRSGQNVCNPQVYPKGPEEGNLVEAPLVKARCGWPKLVEGYVLLTGTCFVFVSHVKSLKIRDWKLAIRRLKAKQLPSKPLGRRLKEVSSWHLVEGVGLVTRKEFVIRPHKGILERPIPDMWHEVM